MENKVKRFFIYYFLIYTGSGLYSTYISVYFADLGYNARQIGIIMAIVPFVAITGQYLFGYTADRFQMPKGLLVFLFFVCIPVLFLYRVNTTFSFLLFVSLLFTFTSCAHVSLSDTITLQYCSTYDFQYSKIRIGGTLGYAFMSLAGGFFTMLSIDSIFVICMILYFLSGICCLFLPSPVKRNGIKHSKTSLFLLKDKTIRILLLLTIIAYIPSSFYTSFFPIYIIDAAGGNSSVAGIAVFLSIMSQVPFLLIANKLLKRMGMHYLIFTSFVAMSVRWLGICFTTSPVRLIIINCLDGYSNIVILFCVVNYLDNYAPKEWKASGQTLFSICAYGIAKIIGNIIGSLLVDSVGMKGAFFACFILTAITSLFLLLKKLYGSDGILKV